MTQPAAESLGNTPEVPADTSGTRRRGPARVLAYGVLPGLIMLLAMTAGGLKWWDSSVRDADLARSESVEAATDSVIAILSYRPDTVERDIAAAQQLVTNRNGLRDRLAREAQNRVIPEAKARQVTATASVPAAASVSAAADRAVVLVFADQTIAAGAEPPADVPASYRVVLDKIDGRWLVSGLDPV